MAQRLILDLSDLFVFLSGQARISGIQRVALNLATHLRKNPKLDAKLAYYDPAYDCYAAFPEHASLDDLDNLRHTLAFTPVRQYRLENYANRPFLLFYHTHRKRLRRIVENRLKPWLSGKRLRPSPMPVSFKDGDILLALGAGWDALEMYRAIEPFAKQGRVSPIVLVHDLIPLLGIPERGGVSIDLFEEWLNLANRCSSRFLACSEQTRSDLADYLRRKADCDVPIEKFPLPHEFLVSDNAPLSDSVLALTGKKYVLSVGPPHIKNGNRLAQAWARLAAQIGPENMPILVFAGSGSRSDITADGVDQIENLMAFVHQPSDTELDRLYRNALFTVFPSVYEGFGLPIAESHWFGKFCVSSNTSSMPEVGGDLCDYFDPYDISDMVETLRRPITDSEYLGRRAAQIDRSKLLTWEQSAGMLYDAIIRITDREE
jgi:glycosyltransferase involved in cell wall biosynthesis